VPGALWVPITFFWQPWVLAVFNPLLLSLNLAGPSLVFTLRNTLCECWVVTRGCKRTNSARHESLADHLFS
jgi:hypothetical protein